MLVSEWDQLPEEMQNQAVRPYYDQLSKQKGSLIAKRLLDIVIATLLLILCLPLLIVLAILIKLDSPGPILYRQERITKNKRPFKINKFRTMVHYRADQGSLITTPGDERITRIGHFLRRTRLDELPQLFNILGGSMTLVGTRPEVSKYVEAYSPEMFATLLLPAGVTSLASIAYKDEQELLHGAESIDDCYINQILPGKMAYNLTYLKTFSIKSDLKLLLDTVKAVLS